MRNNSRIFSCARCVIRSSLALHNKRWVSPQRTGRDRKAAFNFFPSSHFDAAARCFVPGGGSGSDGRGHRLPLTPDPSAFSSHHPAFLDRRCFRSEARPATIPATLFQGTSSAFKLARRLPWVLLTNRGRQGMQVRRDTLSGKSGASQEVKGCSRAAKGR